MSTSDNPHPARPAADETTDVLIVGGSLVGLSSALFLSWHGVPCLAVERHPGISNHPRGAAGNPRTMELFRSVGLEPELRALAADVPPVRAMGRVESLTGKEIFRFDLPADEDLTGITPCSFGEFGQDTLEPALRRRAVALGADVRFNTTLVAFSQDEDGVTGVIRDNATGVERTVRARYLIAADGGRSGVREQLGILRHGQGTIGHQISIAFRADLEGPLRGRRFLVCQVGHPEMWGILGHDATLKQGGLIVGYKPEEGESPDDYPEERCVELVRRAVGVPDLEVEIIAAQPWEMAARVADRFRERRVLLAGDAAHVIPPIGGFGGNAGVQDAHNLAWKLALVLRGVASPALLDTYDAERRPLADFTVGQALLRMRHRGQSDAPPEMLSDLAVMFGFRYRSAAVSGEEGDDSAPAMEPHALTGQPGTRAPHVWLARGGERLSTLDLFGKRFVLLAGPEGDAWREAARSAAAQLGLDIDAHQIGSGLDDVEGRWRAAYGVTPAGATLVRPDGIVAWRSQGSADDPDGALAEALGRALARR